MRYRKLTLAELVLAGCSGVIKFSHSFDSPPPRHVTVWRGLTRFAARSAARAIKNAAGEWCCGEGDCPALNYTPRILSSGYLLENGEVIPFNEAQPSPNGSYVRCHRPDGTRRCFFAPPTSM